MSGLFKLNWQDLFKGMVTAIFTALISFFYTFFKNGGDLMAIDWKQLGGIALVALFGYLLKQLGTDEAGAFFGIGGK